jgi:pimeloyl-ACP methyl ester carboxylesterase
MNPTLNEPVDTGYQRPRDPAEIWLARQWQHVLGFAVGIRENFFSVGGNSLDAARLIDAITVQFGVQLPLNVLTEHPTVERLATLLRDRAEPQSEVLSGPLVAIQDGDGTRPPLFLVHPGHGQVGPYCGLAHALGEEFAVSGIQAAGLYSDAEPRRTVPAMAAAYVDAVRAVRPAGPYLLGGCGIGAAIAHEMAARLDDVRLVAAIDHELLEPPEAWLQQPPGPSDLPRILAAWKERDLVPHDVAPEFVARSLRVWQANQDAVRDWRPSPYPGPVDVFGRLPIEGWPATVVQRAHACGADGQLPDALRELIER